MPKSGRIFPEWVAGLNRNFHLASQIDNSFDRNKQLEKLCLLFKSKQLWKLSLDCIKLIDNDYKRAKLATKLFNETYESQKLEVSTRYILAINSSFEKDKLLKKVIKKKLQEQNEIIDSIKTVTNNAEVTK